MKVIGFITMMLIILVAEMIHATSAYLVAIVAEFSILYFFFARPELKAAREERRTRDALRRHINDTY
ncbi:MAG: hypothetical protein WCK48_03245 [bacterium]